MRRYATSKLRLAFLILIIGGAICAMAMPGMAQTPANPTPAAPTGTTIVSLVMQNRDIVFWTIVGLSIIGLTLIIQGIISTREAVFMPPRTIELIKEMISQRRFQELLDFTENDSTFVSQSLNPALKRAPSFNAMKEAMETAVGEQTAEQFRKIEYLNIIGNLGPLLGLLGTVIGMIEAFLALNAFGGKASPADLSLGISKALVHTMLGLMLAVPCLAAFGVLRTIVDRLTVRGALMAEELLMMIKPADARTATGGAARPSAVPPNQPASLASARA
jgi:biopolymer transport protein ExbB